MAGKTPRNYFKCDCCQKELPDDLLTGFPDVMCVKCYNGEAYDYIIKSLRDHYDKRFAEAEEYITKLRKMQEDRRQRELRGPPQSVAPLY